jgi:hypothetical protein
MTATLIYLTAILVAIALGVWLVGDLLDDTPSTTIEALEVPNE